MARSLCVMLFIFFCDFFVFEHYVLILFYLIKFRLGATPQSVLLKKPVVISMSIIAGLSHEPAVISSVTISLKHDLAVVS